MSKEKVLVGFTTVKSLRYGDITEIKFRKSELDLLAKYLTGGTEQYEPTVILQVMEGKSGKPYVQINTHFYDLQNGGTSGSGSSSIPIANPAPPEEMPF